MTEQELKHYLLKHFGKDFIVRSEVEGKFLVDDSKVIIDYLMFPSPYLVQQGFVEEWFGVEVKAPGKDAKKGLQVSWQAITYSQSQFDGVRPAFVLIYPPLAQFFGSEGESYMIKCLLQKANVGYIEVNQQKRTWAIRFGGGRYFSSDQGLSQTPNVALKRNVGSWK